MNAGTARLQCSRRVHGANRACEVLTHPVTVHSMYAQYAHQAMNPRLFLSASDSSPMYQQVIDQITAKVVSGDWPAGTVLPSIRELASANQISVITVKRAYQELERSGVIVTRHGKGSFVAESLEVPRALLRNELEAHLQALLTCARRLGLSRDELQALIDRAPLPAPKRTRGNQS